MLSVTIVRHFNLLMNFIKPSTYKWNTDRTGNSKQNISNLQGEAKAAINTLSIIYNSCNCVLYPKLSSRVVKIVEAEEEADQQLSAEDAEQQQQQQPDNEEQADNNGEEGPLLDNSSSERVALPSLPDSSGAQQQRKTHKVKHQIWEQQVSDPELLLMHREHLCDEAMDKRELMTFTLATMLKAFKDYKRASANDVDTSRSSMMM